MRQKKILLEKIYRDIRKEIKSEQISWHFHSFFVFWKGWFKMKEKKKLSKLEKCLVQEFEADMKTADRFLRDEECSLPCGSSPGMFLSELFQSCSNLPETDPFSRFAANQDDLLDAGRISILSREAGAGGCMVSFSRRTCDVNGRHYAISDTAYIQIKVEDPGICCSMFMNAANVFAAELFADTFDKCFMMAEVVNSDRICVPLHGFRLFSMHKETGRGDETGIIVECVKSSYTGMHGGIIYGTALDRIRRKLWRDGHTDDFANKRIKK